MKDEGNGMPELILHHYAGSPFGEKICSILGFKPSSMAIGPDLSDAASTASGTPHRSPSPNAGIAGWSARLL